MSNNSVIAGFDDEKDDSLKIRLQRVDGLDKSLHLVFDFAKDRIVWDVGHQAYVHKILTGRKDAFDTLREYGGLSGFPKKKESPTDCFDTGHGGNSVSLCLTGIAI